MAQYYRKPTIRPLRTPDPKELPVNEFRVEIRAENFRFPFARQGARLLRQTEGRMDEEVAMVTSLSPEKFNAIKRLRANGECWAIKNCLHQRLDITYNQDCGRVQSDQGMLLHGASRRVANSLLMEGLVTGQTPVT